MLDYINKFHEKCLEKLTPLLKDDERALNYVKRQCAPLSKWLFFIKVQKNYSYLTRVD